MGADQSKKTQCTNPRSPNPHSPHDLSPMQLQLQQHCVTNHALLCDEALDKSLWNMPWTSFEGPTSSLLLHVKEVIKFYPCQQLSILYLELEQDVIPFDDGVLFEKDSNLDELYNRPFHDIDCLTPLDSEPDLWREETFLMFIQCPQHQTEHWLQVFKQGYMLPVTDQYSLSNRKITPFQVEIQRFN